jgi:hypothetical protein
MTRSAAGLDLVFAAGLGLLTVLSRLPYRARMLYNWDAVQFALALREYDIAKHQPHPPGYILYVALGRLANAWLDDPAAAYVALAVAFSGLTTFVVYALAREIYDRPTALAAATLLAVSPLFWFYGSVGLTYAGEALGASTVAYFAFRALRGSETDAWLAAGYLGLAAGLRQSLLLLLFPLWLGSAIVGLRRWRTVTVGVLLMLGTVLIWFVPMVWLTGGIQRYLDAALSLAEDMVKPTSIVTGPMDATVRMSRHVLESVAVGLGPLALVVFALPWYVKRHGWSHREWFLLAWTLPAVVIYTLIHFGQAGYVLTFLPALVIVLSRVLVAGLRTAFLSAHVLVRAVGTAGVVVLVVMINGSFFVNARPAPRDFDTPRPAWIKTAQDEAFDWIWSRTAAALYEHEQVLHAFVDAIRGLYRPDETVVITELGNPRSYPWLRHAMFYLPEYQIYELRVGEQPPGFYAPRSALAMTRVPGSDLEVPLSVQRLVWFVDHWSPTSERPLGLEEIELPYGRFLYVLSLKRRPMTYAGYTFIREEPPYRDPPRRAVQVAR